MKIISIKQAIHILELENHEFVFITDKRNKHHKLIKIKQILDKINIKDNYVYKIELKFDREDGMFIGFLFVVDTSIYNSLKEFWE